MPDLTSHTDEELISLLKNGSISAFDVLYERYWESLLSKAFDRLKNREDAEEIVQELFIKIWRRSSKIELQYTFKTYIFAALRYEILHFIGKQQYRKDDISLESSDYPTHWVQDEEFHSLEMRELQYQIEAVIDRLPEKCRIIFKLSRDEGLSAKKIADQLELSPRTVENQIGKALRVLKQALKGSDSRIFLIVFELIILKK